MGQERAFEVEARGGILQPPQVPAADAEFGQRIVQLPFPFVAAPARLHGNQPGGKAAVFGKIRRLVDVEHFHAVNRHRQPELAGSGVGDVGGVYDEGAAVLGAGGDHQPAAGLAHHSRNQRQSVGYRGGTAGKQFGGGGGDGRRRTGACGYRVGSPLHLHAFAPGGGLEHHIDRFGDAGGEIHLAMHRLHAVARDRHLVNPGIHHAQGCFAFQVGLGQRFGRTLAAAASLHAGSGHRLRALVMDGHNDGQFHRICRYPHLEQEPGCRKSYDSAHPDV